MMNRSDAKKIAETITNNELWLMICAAKAKITNWRERSIVNKGLTKGAAWNVLAKDFTMDCKYHILAKINMVREFGEFLPDQRKPKKINKDLPAPIHQDPIFK